MRTPRWLQIYRKTVLKDIKLYEKAQKAEKARVQKIVARREAAIVRARTRLEKAAARMRETRKRRSSV